MEAVEVAECAETEELERTEAQPAGEERLTVELRELREELENAEQDPEGEPGESMRIFEDDEEGEEGKAGCPEGAAGGAFQDDGLGCRPRSSELTSEELGKRGEDAAVAYLERKGYRILERNWTCAFGEADIIAADPDGTIVFVEVKTRRSLGRGLPEEAITPRKQRRYENIALAYMAEAEWDDCVALRFDAIGICVKSDFRAMLRHHLACFNGL